MKRCTWSMSSPQMEQYHDREWGTPLHDENKLFEFLILEGFQAGLSWEIILKKRTGFKNAFSKFNPSKVASYKEKEIAMLLENSDIIRNRQKINAAIINAQKFKEVQKEFGSFDSYIWSFVQNKPIINKFKRDSDIPTKTQLAETISKDLIKRGFKFVGPTIIYAHMQATGMVNDHLVSCFRYKQLV